MSRRPLGALGDDVLAVLREDFPAGASALQLSDWIGRSPKDVRASLIRLRTRMRVRHVRRGLWVAA